MLKYNIFTNKFFLYFIGTVIACNLIDLIFILKTYSNNFFLYGTIGISAVLYLLIRKSIKENYELSTKIICFVLLTLFLQGQIHKIKFLPVTAILYSEEYDDIDNDGESTMSTYKIKSVFYNTSDMNCNTKNEILYNIKNQPIDTRKCLTCNNEIANKINKILKANFDDYSFNNVNCNLKLTYFIFSGTAVVNGYKNISDNSDYPIVQFFQYQIEAFIYISLSIAVLHFLKRLFRYFKPVQKNS